MAFTADGIFHRPHPAFFCCQQFVQMVLPPRQYAHEQNPRGSAGVIPVSNRCSGFDVVNVFYASVIKCQRRNNGCGNRRIWPQEICAHSFFMCRAIDFHVFPTAWQSYARFRTLMATLCSHRFSRLQISQQPASKISP